MTDRRDGRFATMGSEDREKTKALAVDAPELLLLRFSLEVIDGPDRGLRAESNDSEFSIGTAPGNQLVLTDQAVSRHHCMIVPHTRSLRIQDLDSTNGTHVNGLRIDAAYLKQEATIGIGITKLLFRVLPDAARRELSSDIYFQDLLGTSAPMRRIFALLPRIAESNATVLLVGETGTGKTLLAESIHAASDRCDGPFLVVDCGAIAPTLIESELFGHEKGAFTGADRLKPGAFEAAEGGTVLLDEVGELPIEMQPKLLRVLEERSIRRVGGLSSIKLNCRVIATTNRDLRAEVNRGRFRVDLYYRLDTVTVRVPSLRERRRDIPILVEHFVELFRDPNASPPEIPQALIDDWSKRDWPGNVRELRSAVEREVVLGRDARFAHEPWSASEGSPASRPALEPLPQSWPPNVAAAHGEVDTSRSFRLAKDDAVQAWEEKYVRRLLELHDGNLSRAARAARMDRGHLRQLVSKYSISVRRPRGS